MIEMKNGIVEIGRIIVKLQLEIANEGNRLSKKEDDDGGQMEMAKIKVAQIKVKK